MSKHVTTLRGVLLSWVPGPAGGWALSEVTKSDDVCGGGERASSQLEKVVCVESRRWCGRCSARYVQRN
jgi:hypothetical protein